MHALRLERWEWAQPYGRYAVSVILASDLGKFNFCFLKGRLVLLERERHCCLERSRRCGEEIGKPTRKSLYKRNAMRRWKKNHRNR